MHLHTKSFKTALTFECALRSGEVAGNFLVFTCRDMLIHGLLFNSAFSENLWLELLKLSFCLFI